MAGRKPVLTVTLSRAADNELDRIYRYTLGEHGLGAADRHMALLQAKMASLSTDYNKGKSVMGWPDLRYLLMKKRNSGDGHIAVYRIDEASATVEVWFIFHTKQDWENKL